MRMDKAIRDLPWPEYTGVTAADLAVAGCWKVQEHERVLVLTFTVNREKKRGGVRELPPDFRVAVSKKRRDFAVLVKGEARAARKDIRTLAPERLSICYPDVSAKVEQMIAAVTGLTCQNHNLGALCGWCDDVLAEQARAARQKKGVFEDEEVALCPDALPEGLCAWVRETVLAADDTAIYKKGGTRGHCYLCHSDFTVHGEQKMRQHGTVVCPHCGEKLWCHLSTGESWKNDYVENIMAIQRGEGGTVWLRVWHVARDSEDAYEPMERYLREIARYGIRGANVGMWLLEAKENTYYGRSPSYRLRDWTRSGKLYRYDGGAGFFFPGGIREAVAGTRLEYAQLERYIAKKRVGGYRPDPWQYCLDFARYPVMEYLWKAGFHQLLCRRMDKGNRNAIRWQRDSLRECFRFPIRLLREKPPEAWDMDGVKLMGDSWAMAKWPEPQRLAIFRAGITDADVYAHDLPTRVLAYLDKQMALAMGNGRHETQDTIARIYRDYLGECRALELDMTDKAVLYPPDLFAAHERTAGQVKHKKSAIQQKAFREAAAALEKWRWERDGLSIRPAQSGDELQAEGAALKHCVGGYAAKMANGETAIFLIRRSDAPDTPYFTLEYQDKRVMQCRGLQNGSYKNDPAVAAFVEAWLREVVNAKAKPKKKKGEKVA